jgi:hypothetical protein
MSAETAVVEGVEPGSAEEKFFGVNHPVVVPEPKAPEEEEQLEIEVLDDDRPAPKAGSLDNEETVPEEIDDLSEKMQDRIKHLTWRANEEKRQREQAEHMRDEAVKFGQSQLYKVQQQQALLSRGEHAYAAQIKQRAEADRKRFEQDLKNAHDTGDSEAIIAAQKGMIDASWLMRQAEQAERGLAGRAQQPPPPPPQQPTPSAPPVPTPDPRAEQWAKENPWFTDNSNPVYVEMKSTALGIHQRLLEEGVDPNIDPDKYYGEIKRGMRKRYPEYEWTPDEKGQAGQAAASQASSVVAPARRTSVSSKPRTVQLTPTQIALAEKFGLTKEQYAKAYLEMEESGK